ncbi:uncharacterized protein LOC110443140 [Mizuhopecten yessoensis]|uniref:uncharacterized protein LOC110443140 n=1 Tax=Mizuhopecten yessoensis TaxID=6573 RepID=UPI000B45D932|nr:uncharacterized protein LOC110443140 [Mizuhopecten yessoensis]
MNENKPIWCFVDGKIPIFIDKSEDAKFPILTNGRRYKKDSREWLHKTSKNRGKNMKRTVDNKTETMDDHKSYSVENVYDTMDTGKESGGSSPPLNSFGSNADIVVNRNGIRLSPYHFFGNEDRELAPNQITTRGCMSRSESSRRLRKRRLSWLKTEKNENCCIEVAERSSQHDIKLEHTRFRPIVDAVGLGASELLDPMAGKSHGDVHGHSLEISTSFWFDSEDSIDDTCWRETRQSLSDSSLEDFVPELEEGARPIDPTLIRSPVPKKRERLTISEDFDPECQNNTDPSGQLLVSHSFQSLCSTPRCSPWNETDSEQHLSLQSNVN